MILICTDLIYMNIDVFGKSVYDCDFYREIQAITTTDISDSQKIYQESFDLGGYREIFLAHLLAKVGTYFIGRLDIVYPKEPGEKPHIEFEPKLCSTNAYIDIGITNAPNLIDIAGNYYSDEKDSDPHSNVLLINIEKRTIELFEPHGNAYWTNSVFEEIKTYLSAQYPNYQFIHPLDYCPNISIQALTGDSLCINWTALYVSLRMICPDIPRDKVINGLMDLGKEGLETLMKKWTVYMYNYSDRYHILEIVDYMKTISWKKRKELQVQIIMGNVESVYELAKKGKPKPTDEDNQIILTSLVEIKSVSIDIRNSGDRPEYFENRSITKPASDMKVGSRIAFVINKKRLVKELSILHIYRTSFKTRLPIGTIAVDLSDGKRYYLYLGRWVEQLALFGREKLGGFSHVFVFLK
jgi:hypothetical protein